MKSLLHYPGSKKRLAPWIIENMPEHHSYLEPYFGGGAVLFEKPPSRIETVNNLDGDVVNFFRVIQNPESRRTGLHIRHIPGRYTMNLLQESYSHRWSRPVALQSGLCRVMGLG